MANVTPRSGFGAVYQIETTDYATGGPDGVANRQAKELYGNDLALQEEVNLVEARLDVVEDTVNDAGTGMGQLNTRVGALETKTNHATSGNNALNNRTNANETAIADLQKIAGGIKGSNNDIDSNYTLVPADNGKFLVPRNDVTVTIPSGLHTNLPLTGQGHIILWGGLSGFIISKPTGVAMVYGGPVASGTLSDATACTIDVPENALVNLYISGNQYYLHIAPHI